MPSPELEAQWSSPEASAPFLRDGFDPTARDSDCRSPHPPGGLRSGTDLGRLLGERYVVLDWIGRGGMADVFLARDTAQGRLVAVKLLAKELRGSKEHRERMLREADIATTVSHPNVVQTLDAGIAECGTPFIVLEALVGETLHEYLERHGAMAVEEALPLLRQLVEGLAAAHEAKIIHGDIKPKNVFLCGPIGSPQSVKLIDFGLARSLKDELDGASSETIAGTLEYLAPEQAVADAIDERSDIYALGVIAFRWLTGELPFDTHLGTQLLAHQLTSPAPPMSWLVPDMLPSLDAWVLVSMRKARENRYQSASAMLRDLDAIIQGESVISGAPMVTCPDAYTPETELGKRALAVLLKADHGRMRVPQVA